MNEGSVLWKWLVMLTVAGLICLFGVLVLVKHERHVGPGEEILWDDFAFVVLDHRVEKRIGDIMPKGVFQVVHVEVRNHAQRVPYGLDNHRVVLKDEDGAQYPVDKAAERVLDPTWPQHDEIAPGTTFSSELAFDVPADKKNLRLRISWGGPLIDLVDDNIFGPRDIALR